MAEMMANRELRRDLGRDLEHRLSREKLSVQDLAAHVAEELHMKPGSARGFVYRILKAKKRPEYPHERDSYSRYFEHFTVRELNNYATILRAAGFSNRSPIVRQLKKSFPEDFRY